MKKLTTLVLILFVVSVKAQLCSSNASSLMFDGNSSYVSLSSDHDLNPGNEITVEAWINPSSFGASSSMNSIVCKHGWSLGEKGYVLRSGGNGELSFNISGIDNQGNPTSWKEVISAPGALQLNKWQHVAGTYDGHKLRIYIDGNLSGSLNFNGEINTGNDYDLKIGRIADNGAANGRYFSGLIDEVRIWDEALSETDIRGDMTNQVNPLFTNDLIGYWRFNENNGSGSNDLGTGNNNATLHNATWNTSVGFTNGVARPTISQSGYTLTSSSLLGNQWNVNGVAIQGADNSTYNATEDGAYSVTVDYGLGCEATSDEIQIIILSISENNNDNLISYQLSDKILSINSEMNLEKSTLSVFDIEGRTIKSNRDIHEKIDLSELSSGLYIVNVQSDELNFRKKFYLQQ